MARKDCRTESLTGIRLWSWRWPAARAGEERRCVWNVAHVACAGTEADAGCGTAYVARGSDGRFVMRMRWWLRFVLAGMALAVVALTLLSRTVGDGHDLVSVRAERDRGPEIENRWPGRSRTSR